MEKITFASADSQENEEFFVLEQTKLNGVSYILVTDSEEDDAECWILKDTSPEESSEAIYEFVEDERLLVLQVLAENKDRHLTAEDIYELVKEDYPEIGLATIYRTVQLLLEMQLVDRISLDDGCARYEIGEFFDGEERHHHHHLICRTCGKILPFKDDLLEDLEDKIEDTTGFHVLDHELKFYGQCRECQKRGRKK